MATVAELKARLAKHAAAAQRPGGILNDEPSTAKVAPAPSADIGTRAATLQNEVVRTSESADVSTVHPVRTDLQPTTLVVVERPSAEPTVVDNVERVAVPTNLDTSNPVHQGFLQRLSDLEAALLHRDPLMKTHLGQIHKTMMEYEEIASLLTVEEISGIMAAQQVHTNVVLAGDVKKAGKAAANKRAAQISLNDV